MKALAEQIGDLDAVNIFGRVVGVRGLMVEVAGPIHAMSVGGLISVETGQGRNIPCEVIGFSGSNAVLMPFAGLDGVRRGCRAVIANVASPWSAQPPPGSVASSMRWASRSTARGLCRRAPRRCFIATRRRRLMQDGASVRLSISACAHSTPFLTCCRGQRLGIFAGSGVGKSVLLSMLARNVDADVSVIGLVGERGREVQEFLQDDLGDEGLARSVAWLSRRRTSRRR